MVGFAPKSGFTPNAHAYGWFLYLHDGKLYCQGRDIGRRYRTEVALGSVVTCILDRKTNSISFQVNADGVHTYSERRTLRNRVLPNGRYSVYFGGLVSARGSVHLGCSKFT